MTRVLQLSDLHFGSSHGFAQLDVERPLTLAGVIERSLKRASESPDFDAIVLNGDLFSLNTSEERAQAEDGLKKLLDVVNAEVVLPVPGNHDIAWDPALSPSERLSFYSELVDRIVPGELPRPAQYPHVVSVGSSARKLAFVLLDSCRIESKTQAGLGYVGTDQLDLVAPRLEQAGVSPESHVVIAVQHHHLVPVAQDLKLPATADPEASPRMLVSVTVDATDVLRELNRAGVRVVMHGHQHVHTIITMRDRRWSQADAPLYIAACGSCGVDEAGVRRHFNIWEFGEDSAHVKGFVENDDDRQIFGQDYLLELDL